MILSMDFIGRGALLSSVVIFAMTVGADAQDRGQDRDGVYLSSRSTLRVHAAEAEAGAGVASAVQR